MKPEPFSKNRFKLNLDGIDHSFEILVFNGHDAIRQPFSFSLGLACDLMASIMPFRCSPSRATKRSLPQPKPAIGNLSQMTIVVYLEVTYQIKDHCIGRLK
ncbi:hypothetical protein [Pseudomonas viridiflava]|uniref:hypothetical protein n=1 Tax=Pseudomonas viridiflava TaxID=33069 RepID=UPI000F0216D6|nr:hypothetical protein [Pseudomonas viridiflava]